MAWDCQPGKRGKEFDPLFSRALAPERIRILTVARRVRTQGGLAQSVVARPRIVARYLGVSLLVAASVNEQIQSAWLSAVAMCIACSGRTSERGENG